MKLLHQKLTELENTEPYVRWLIPENLCHTGLHHGKIFIDDSERLERRIPNVTLGLNLFSHERYIGNPAFQSFRIINKDLAMVKSRVTKILWNKPTYIGFCVLELSKLLMQQFDYEYVRPTYQSRAKLLFTDTDSLCYELSTEDAYADMRKELHRFDTSDYDKSHPNYSAENCKVIGKFKDECNGAAPLEFVGLRSKMYSLIMPSGKEKSTAKGIKASYAKDNIKHQDYLRCFQNETTTTASYHQIGSSNHQLSTNAIVKSALSPFDDKRYLLANSGDTLAHGHWRIAEFQRTGNSDILYINR